MIVIRTRRETRQACRFEGNEAMAAIGRAARALETSPRRVIERMRAGEEVRTSFFTYRLDGYVSDG